MYVSQLSHIEWRACFSWHSPWSDQKETFGSWASHLVSSSKNTCHIIFVYSEQKQSVTTNDTEIMCETISWPDEVTIWNLVVTVVLLGKQQRLHCHQMCWKITKQQQYGNVAGVKLKHLFVFCLVHPVPEKLEWKTPGHIASTTKGMDQVGLKVVMRAGCLTLGTDRRAYSSCELACVG